MSVRSKLAPLLRPRVRPLVWLILAVVAWWTWMGLAMGALALVNNGILTPEAYASLKVALTISLLVGLTVFYLWLVEKSSWREGLAVGLVVVAVTVAMDAWFYVRMSGDIGATQLVSAIPAYAATPIATTLILGLLRKR